MRRITSFNISIDGTILFTYPCIAFYNYTNSSGKSHYKFHALDYFGNVLFENDLLSTNIGDYIIASATANTPSNIFVYFQGLLFSFKQGQAPFSVQIDFVAYLLVEQNSQNPFMGKLFLMVLEDFAWGDLQIMDAETLNNIYTVETARSLGPCTASFTLHSLICAAYAGEDSEYYSISVKGDVNWITMSSQVNYEGVQIYEKSKSEIYAYWQGNGDLIVTNATTGNRIKQLFYNPPTIAMLPSQQYLENGLIVAVGKNDVFGVVTLN